MIATLSLALLCSAPHDWPAFLGRGGQLTTDVLPPKTWTPTSPVWKASLPGHGQSSPIVWGGRVYVTAVEGPKKERYHVLALDLATGDPTWRIAFDNATPQDSTLFVSRAAPTPCADADGVYAFFESGQILALGHDGRERWRRDLAADHGAFQGRFGLGSSPAQSADRLVLLVDHEGPSYVIALDKRTGETAWRTERSPRVSWSSPIVTEIEGVPQVVVSSAGSVDGYALADGELLWSFTEVGGNTVNTPYEVGPGRFLIGASPGEGRETERSASRSNLALHVERDAAGEFHARVLWVAERVSSSFCSPIAVGGLAYFVNRAGVLQVVDLQTGERRFEERIGTACWASPIAVAERIYFFGKDGDTVVVRSGDVFEKLSENRLWETGEGGPDDPAARGAETFGGRIQYGVALAGERLLVRTGDVLYALPATRG